VIKIGKYRNFKSDHIFAGAVLKKQKPCLKFFKIGLIARKSDERIGQKLISVNPNTAAFSAFLKHRPSHKLTSEELYFFQLKYKKKNRSVKENNTFVILFCSGKRYIYKKTGGTLKSLKFDIKGMHCASCSSLIQMSLKNLNGVKNVSVNLLTNSAVIEADETEVKPEDIIQIIENAGFSAQISEGEKKKP
jgi:copper chaperone CopZ